MSVVRRDSVGIVPAGALGVAFFHHLTSGGRRNLDRVTFLQRPGSANAWRAEPDHELRIRWDGEIRSLSIPSIWRGTPIEEYERNQLPEILLVCTQPDQILGVINEVVTVLERLCESAPAPAAAEELPYVVLCSNGIYFQRVRQYFLEKLEEATLLGRLPDLWPDAMPRVVRKLLRGVTIQTGQRLGSGADAIYQPGAAGPTRIAGGDAEGRRRCVEVLGSMGGWFDAADAVTPTRAEFDKALINLTMNLLGQLESIDQNGAFRALTVREILHAEDLSDARELAKWVIETGRAVHAYRDEPVAVLWEEMVTTCEAYLDHVPSSLQWIGLQLEAGTLEPRITPTEKWLLEPLIRYAHAAGLEDAAVYFENLVIRLEERLRLAIDYARGQKKRAEPEGSAPR